MDLQESATELPMFTCCAVDILDKKHCDNVVVSSQTGLVRMIRLCGYVEQRGSISDISMKFWFVPVHCSESMITSRRSDTTNSSKV